MTALLETQTNGKPAGGQTAPGQPEPGMIDFDNPDFYINREMSMLQFQWRVFEEAADRRNPLLERVKFLAIVAGNMDEFYMVRVGGLKFQLEAGYVDLPPDKLTPAEQLAAIRKEAHRLMRASRDLLSDDLKPGLAGQGVHILNYDELTERQLENVQDYFHEIIFPVLTPLAFDPGHPFPHISNLSLNLAITIRDPLGVQHFARVKVPGNFPRLFPLKRSSGAKRKDGTVPFNHFFVWLEQIIAANLKSLFPGMDIIEVHPFRVTRNADMVIQELEADDLLETMEQSVMRRQFGTPVRVTVNPQMPEAIREILIENMGLDRNDLYVIDGPLGLHDLMSIYDSVDRYELHYPPFIPAIPRSFSQERGPDIFAAIRRHDILLHHPYDSFAPVINFLEAAATDPQVLAIKQTLYRTGRNSPIVKALLTARQNGKQVAALVELKARFDEESNIEWAKILEDEGVHVTYGLLGLKTHAKLALVVRQEEDKIRRYVHLATGNYNAVTAHVYEDIGLFTADPDFGADASDLFNSLTGYSAKNDYRKIWVAPDGLRARLETLIEREITHAGKRRKAHIIIKCNHIVDAGMIQWLYRASMAGVRINLLVRGICCLRPGIPGLSENITVHSIIGRFLEHSRIYYFQNQQKPEIYIGSADLMPRNLTRRVEVLFPLQDPNLVRRVRHEILETGLNDNTRARRMNPDGSFERLTRVGDQAALDSQLAFLKMRS